MIVNVFRWLSTSFQNRAGKVCSKRTTVFAFVLMMFYMIIFHSAEPNTISVISILSGTIVIILGAKDHYEVKESIKENE